METKFNFKSQICTDKIQSERLLSLGLKKETADMALFEYIDFDVENNCNYKTGEYEAITATYSKNIVFKNIDLIPAWSLGRLIEICGKDRLPISFHKKGKVKIRVNHIHPTHDGRSGYNYYDSIIDCIEWLIKEGYFNKEYLEE